MAHVLDEQRREKGETAGIAEKLIDVLSKMREEEKVLYRWYFGFSRKKLRVFVEKSRVYDN